MTVLQSQAQGALAEFTSRKSRSYLACRNSSGSAITEFGPALGILLICFFFPLLNMLVLGVSYCLCMVLNYNQVHEASLLPMNDAASLNGPVCKDITDRWLNGMGKFVKTEGYPQTVISYRDGHTTNNVTDRIAMVQTTVKCQPTLSIPLFGASVPGLNAPMAFSVSSESTMENPDNAPVGNGGQNQSAKVVSSGNAVGKGNDNGQNQSLSGGGWDLNDLRISVRRPGLLRSGGQ
ncbi:MAG: hypothetical protein QG574_1590 [Cyanobacteriota bacterium erpe_2018_sw_21hr_WHONDRS-SW48-000092_B_bin.40]|nr:hypothetical protein [Cyanobacteriota bacterium erpe_2018_sw_21hr_WHONDRS-SW48-000092_B_bin.40]